MSQHGLLPDQKKWENITRLLDDDNLAVRDALLREFNQNPDESLIFLKDIVGRPDNILVKHAQDFIKQLGWVDGVGDFFNFIRSLRYELESGWFLLDRTIFPNFDISSSTLFLDQMADRTKELLVPPQNAREICSTLNRVFFHEYNFRAAGKDFSNPENSFLHKVIARKKGLPITLCVLYLLVSRRIGFDLEPIGIPGRFMLGCFSEKIPFYIDVWSGGKFYEVEQMESFLGNFSSDESGSYLLPVTVGETLTRGCRNLVQQYIKSGDSKKSELFQSFVDEFEKVHRKEANA